METTDLYEKDGTVLPRGSIVLAVGGRQTVCPTPEALLEAGWKPYEPSATEPAARELPSEAETLAALARLAAPQLATLGDAEAAAVAALYPTWASRMGQQVAAGERLWHAGRLWKVLQAHTVQQQWAPGSGTESLYAPIDASHAGTAQDPVPYTPGMELDEGKYYSQGGALWRCTRSTGQPVYADLAALEGIYVEALR